MTEQGEQGPRRDAPGALWSPRRLWTGLWLALGGLFVSSFFLTYSDWVLVPFALSGACFLVCVRAIWRR